jgi:hypothetical protein
VAAVALAATIGGHGLSFSFGDDDEGSSRNNDGPRTVRTLENLKDFDGVTVTGPDDVVVSRGKSFLVEAEGNKAILDRLNLFVSEGVLHVERKSGMSMGGHRDATVRVTLPALHRVTLTGPGDVRVDRLEGKDAKAQITGPGDLTIGMLDAESAELALTGPGDLTVTGKAKTATLSTTGPGDIIARNLQTERATLKIIGSGDIVVNASQGADISILGPGNARVTGTTTCQISKAGPGEARCTD